MPNRQPSNLRSLGGPPPRNMRQSRCKFTQVHHASSDGSRPKARGFIKSGISAVRSNDDVNVSIICENSTLFFITCLPFRPLTPHIFYLKIDRYLVNRDGQPCPGLDKPFTPASQKVCHDIPNQCCAQLTSCSDQDAPASTKESPPASTSSEDQPPAGPSHDNVVDSSAPRPPSSLSQSADQASEDATPARKRLKSPTNSIKAGDRTRSPSPNRHLKGRHNTPVDESTADFPARPAARSKERLWNEGDPILTRTPAAQPSPQQHSRPSRRGDNNRVGNQRAEEEEPSVNTMIAQPDSRPISQEQLVAEVKGIYAGLVPYVIPGPALRLLASLPTFC